MDKLYNTQMQLAQQISVAHTRKVLGGKIGLMFYDVTTLYFETAKIYFLYKNTILGGKADCHQAHF